MSTVDNPEEDTYNVGFDGIEFNDDELRKIKEKASPFTAGMNPTVRIQPTFGMLNECFKCLHIV